MSDPDEAPAPVVLLVEDETLLRMFNADTLVEAGYRVLEAATVDEGMLIFQARPDIEAVVTDVQTPGHKDGLELAHLVCHTRPGVAVVVVSGRARPAAASFPTGVEFLEKPYKPSDLLLVLSHAMQTVKDGGLEC